MKIVINNQHGGFGLSHEAILRYLDLKGKPVWVRSDPAWKWSKQYSLVPFEERIDNKDEYELRTSPLGPKDWHEWSLEQRQAWNEKYREQTFHDSDLERNDPVLVQVVEELGEDANGAHAELKIVEIPDDVEWQIDEYDGVEWVAEKHRTWS
jgi:hypothetical protein